MKTKNFKFKSMALVLFALVLSSNVWGAETVIYTLTPVTGSDNGYATAEDINCTDSENDLTITWNVMGNSKDYAPWRIGGKGITNAVRPLYSKDKIDDNVTKVVVSYGGTMGLTSASAVLKVYSTASDAASGSNNNLISTVNGDDGTNAHSNSIVANATHTFVRPNNADWSNAYYRFEFICTYASTGSNKFFLFNEAKFYSEATPSCTTPPTVSSSLSNTSSTTSSITATVGITSIGGCDITENGLVYSTTEATPTVGGSGCSRETVTACGSTAANKTVTISGLACGQSYYVCGYATNAAGTRYSNVSQISTLACPVDHFIDNVQGTAQQDKQGDNYTIPSCGDKTKGSECEGEHYKFIGWSSERIQTGEATEPSGLLKAGNKHDADGTTYYAVWAKEAE